VDEYLTSQMCHECGSQLFPVHVSKKRHVHSLKACQNCFTVRNRDSNAASNIEQAFVESQTTGLRPLHLRRDTKRDTLQSLHISNFHVPNV
jgi:transposase